MGIRSFFHKIKMWFVRLLEPGVPFYCNEEAKRFGNYGEDRFWCALIKELPCCKVKRNVVVSTLDGNAEIDCLVLYKSKLFCIEIKRWKGALVEREDCFYQEKTDRWTGERHVKFHKSPFKQLDRAIYLLKKQIPTTAWINPIVFFDGDELQSIFVSSPKVWFDNYEDIVTYIRNNGKTSSSNEANEFFEKCVCEDWVYSDSGMRKLSCIISRNSLRFEIGREVITAEQIAYIHISHHWYYDELNIKLTDGRARSIILENAKIQVQRNGHIEYYPLCKLGYIEIGGCVPAP